MPNFPPTRIAVNLLLIVLLAMQPVAMCNSVACCAQSEGGQIADRSCGCHCGENRAAQKRTCCCSRRQAKVAENTKPACCGSSINKSGQPDRVEPIAAMLQSVCLCDQQAPPISDSSPRGPVIEVQTANPIAWQSLDDLLRPPSMPDWDRAHRESSNSPNRFAQILLGHWRL